MTDEEWVRAHWDQVHIDQPWMQLAGDPWFLIYSTAPGYCRLARSYDLGEGWREARTFTEQRLEEIRCVESEIELLGIYQNAFLASLEYTLEIEAPIDNDTIINQARLGRTLSRLQSILTDLQRGMKTPTHPA